MKIRSKTRPLVITTLLVTLLSAVPAAAQCDNGREGILSDLAVGASALEWRLLAEHRAVTLTVSAPCGLVVERTYEEGKNPFFDLKEIPADPDGVYHWQLRIAPHVDPEVEQVLKKAREAGKDQTIEYELRQKGMLPEGPFLQTGAFTVFRGAIVPPDLKEEGSSGGKLSAGVRPASSVADNCPFTGPVPAVESSRLSSIAPAVDRGGSNRPLMMAAAETPRRMTEKQVISGDLTVYNSLCVGFDCATSETYGSDTIRLKENNLRIHFEDTSTAAGFPSTDWRIEVNSQSSGGGNYFRINDVTGNRSPFTIEGGAPSHSLYVDNTGRIGRRTANPVLDLHIVDGDTPGVRLEQDGSSGFGAQTWDIAGNETNFFVRDASSGSTLPFRIFPGSPSSSLVVRNGRVGSGTNNPTNALHIRRTDGTAQIFIEERSATEAARELAFFKNNGTTTFRFTDNNGTPDNDGDDHNWLAGLRTNNTFIITPLGTIGTPRWQMDSAGNVTATSFTPSSRALKDDFEAIDERRILERLQHLPLTTWRYKQDPNSLHLGPTAEDFAAAFGLGKDEVTIGVGDVSGVALAAIKGLHQLVDERDQKIADLERRLVVLEAALHQTAPAP